MELLDAPPDPYDANSIRYAECAPDNTQRVVAAFSIEPCKCVTQPYERLSAAVKTLLDTQK